MRRTGIFGIFATVVGIVLLLVTFLIAYLLLVHYQNIIPSGDLTTSMSVLLYAAIEALFLGVMGWVGSLLLLRGIDFAKVERGIGVVTFKVDKGVGIVTQPGNAEEGEAKTVS